MFEQNFINTIVMTVNKCCFKRFCEAKSIFAKKLSIYFFIFLSIGCSYIINSRSIIGTINILFDLIGWVRL